MIPLLAGGALLGLTSAIGFALLFGKMVSRERFSDFDAEWLNNFSLAKYKPMERLFAEEDYEFLARQKGYRRRCQYHPQAYSALTAESSGWHRPEGSVHQRRQCHGHLPEVQQTLAART